MQFKKYILISVVILNTLNILAQSGPNSEEELKKTANDLFEEGRFIEAEPMFAQLLALYPKDANYNFKYGASLLAADGDKLKPLKYLKFAISSTSVDPRAYYYLGKAYHLNYEFAKAVKQYSKFKNKGDSDDKEKFAIERQIEMCKNGRNLLSKINDVQVLNKQEISAKDFFRIYDLKGIDGFIIAKPQDFMSKYDKKIGDKSIIYLPRNANEVYYSSYGNKGANGKDLFKAVKLGNGNWGDPVSLGEVINTPFDEEFAFIHPDGRTLYFASKGHSSMGGYDLFMSTFDNTTNDWTTPINLDFAFSSADDDVLFITDEDKNFAFFASNRTNSQGKYTVYKVKVEKEAADVSVIKGAFIAENSPGLKNAKITVIEKETNKTIGVYETDANGNYLVEIGKNGGTYQFNIETSDDSPIHTGIVNVPVQDEFEVLGQELRLVGEGDAQQLVIKNIFDGTAASKTASGPQISSDLIRRKASLDVNLSASEILALESNTSNSELAVSSTTDVSNSNQSTPDRVADNVGSEKQPDEVNSISTTTNSNATNTSSPNALLNRDLLVNELDQLYDQLQQDKSVLESAANLAFASSKKLKDDADQQFEEYEKKKSSNAPDEVLNTSLQKAKETALKSAYAAQLANKFEAKKEDLNEKENQLNVTKGLVESNELELAQKQIQTIKSQSEIGLNSGEIIKQEKSEINEAIELSRSKKNSLANKVESFEKENNELATKISEIEQKINNGDDDSESLQSQLKDYRLDQADMDYQIQTARNQLANEELNAKALDVKMSQLIESESSFAVINEASNIAALSTQDKSELLSGLKDYQNTDKLAYTVSENNNTVNQSSNTTEKLVDSSPNNGSVNQTSPVSNLSTSDIDSYYENLISEKQLLSDIEQSSAEQLIVYSNWNKDLQGKMIEKEVSLNTIENDDEKANVQGEIDGILVRINSNEEAVSRIENIVGVNQDNTNRLAENQEINNNNSESNVSSNNNRQNSISQGSPSSNSAITQPTVAVENIDVSAVDETSIIPDNYTSLKLKQDYIYDNQEIRSGVADAKKSYAEAATYGKKADEARNSAYTLSTIEARNAAFDKAGEYERASKEKQIETAIKFGKVNELEYNKNVSLINNSDNYGDDFQSSNLDIANLLATEADLYFNKAKDVRESIVDSDRLSKKESSLQKAYDFEMLALSKQDEALRILKVVESEYEINPVTNLYAINNTAAIANVNSSASDLDSFIEINDAEVLSINSADEAMFIADSLNAYVSSLQIQKGQINTQIEGTRNDEKRTTLEAQIVDINILQEDAKQKIELFELRAKQLNQENELADEYESNAKRNVLSPAVVETLTNSISIDTVNISEEKEVQIKNSTVYNQYITNANKRARAIKSAEMAYEAGVDLEIKKQQLIKQASVLKSQAASSSDENEKQRLIKEANIIDQRAAQKSASVDSINNIIKIKNFLITSSDRTMKSSIANLSPLEQAEIQKIANLNVSSDPLPGEDLADLPVNIIENTGFGVLGSNVNSNEIINPTNLNSTNDNITPEENTDIPVSEEAANNVTESRTDSNPTIQPKDINSGDDFANSDNIEPTNNTTIDNSTTEINTAEKNTNSLNVPTKPTADNPNAVNTSGNIPDVSNLPRVVKQAIFVTLSPKESAYNADKPIPVNPAMPEGLIYKVQVGAFRNPIPQNLFKGFAPLMAEKIPSGITRYTAGIFLNEKEAVSARNEIRGIGYPDAFVVAFFNGKRIGIAQARKTDSSAEGVRDVVASKSNNSGANSTSDNTGASSTIPKSSTGTKAALPSQFNSASVANVVNAETIEGVYYTVQIGVFSKPLPKREFDKYQPLNVKVLSNGLIRYNSGVFKDAVDANQLKEQISKSIGDAFVTAYYNGKRISLAEAARISNIN